MSPADFIIRVLDALVQTTMGFVIGRLVLDFLVRDKQDNFFYGLVRKPTDWLFNGITRVIPKLPYLVVAVLALALLFVLRIALNQVYLVVFGLPASI
jgi:hypothetical protein